MDINNNTILSNYGDVLLPIEVQEILHIGRNAVYKCLADGTIKSIRISGKYRIPKLYLAEFMYGDDFNSLINGEQ